MARVLTIGQVSSGVDAGEACKKPRDPTVHAWSVKAYIRAAGQWSKKKRWEKTGEAVFSHRRYWVKEPHNSCLPSEDTAEPVNPKRYSLS